MSTPVYYQGIYLGKICLDDTNTKKFVFVADNLEGLTSLFSLSPDNIIEVEALGGEIPYKEFKDKHLKDVIGFYPTQDDWILKNHPEKSVAAFGVRV